jgi:hypothetical protein
MRTSRVPRTPVFAPSSRYDDRVLSGEAGRSRCRHRWGAYGPTTGTRPVSSERDTDGIPATEATRRIGPLEDADSRSTAPDEGHNEVSIVTDPVASPTGFPFKVVQIAGTLSDDERYDRRDRKCDLGYLRTAYRDDDGNIGWRCPAEPVDDYVRKDGVLDETVGRRCLCNALMADIGLAQMQADGEIEPAGDLRGRRVRCRPSLDRRRGQLPRRRRHPLSPPERIGPAPPTSGSLLGDPDPGSGADCPSERSVRTVDPYASDRSKAALSFVEWASRISASATRRSRPVLASRVRNFHTPGSMGKTPRGKVDRPGNVRPVELPGQGARRSPAPPRLR